MALADLRKCSSSFHILAFTAVKYANLGRFIGLGGYYTVTMNVPNAATQNAYSTVATRNGVGSPATLSPK